MAGASASTWVHPRFYFWWVPCYSSFSFLVLFCYNVCVFTFLVPCCYVPFRFAHKKNDIRFVFTYSCLYEGSCLIYVICVCLCIVMSNTYCVVFCFSPSYVPMLPVSLDWPFLILPSVLSNVYILTFIHCVFCFVCLRPPGSCVPQCCEFLWTVNVVVVPFRFSLTFICY